MISAIQGRGFDYPDAAAMAERVLQIVAAATPRPGIVTIELDGAKTLVIDMAARKVTARQPSAEEAATTIVATAKDLAEVADRLIEPATSVTFGPMKLTGPIEPAIRCLNMIAGRRYPPAEDYSRGIPLPSATTDKALAWSQLQIHGYCIVADAVPPDQLKAARDRLVDQAAGEREAGIGYFDGGPPDPDVFEKLGQGEATNTNQRVMSLHNKGQALLDLLTLPLIDEFMTRQLGDWYMVSDYQANIAGPGGYPMVLHFDQQLMQPRAHFPLGLNSIVCLDEFTDENGATRIVPGSHLVENGRWPENPRSIEGTVAAAAPAGSIVFFDSRVWHGTGANRSSELRHGLIIYFVRQWCRQVENGTLAVHPATHARMTDRMRALYGFRVGNNGRVQYGKFGDYVTCYDPDKLVLELSGKAGA